MSNLLCSKSVFAMVLACLVTAFPLTSQTILVQPYLQLATPTSMVVMWETNTNTETIVQYGVTPSLGSSASGTTLVTLNATVLHTSSLTGLSPATRYYYKAKTGSWQSAIYDFVTPPNRDSEASFNIVLMSDMQKDGSNPNIFANLINTSLLPYIDSSYGTPLSDHLQMAVLPGDVVDNGNDYGQWKNDFFDPGQALWRSVPCYPAIGNHEVNSQNYFNYYTLPENGTPGYLEHWYYHDYSNVRVISINSNSPYRIQAQLNWVDSILNLSCADTLIDFVFAEMHHPFKSELWTPGEADYTGDVVEMMEAFTETCGKPTIHFFGHTHAYSRGQSRDHDHLWVNVATSGGNIDYWGEFSNADYDEFIISQDEYGFVMVEVTAGAQPKFVLKRLSFGDQFNPGGATETDMVTIRKNNAPPTTPYPLFPLATDTVSSVCTMLKADPFADADGDGFGAAHWQVSTDSSNFSSPVFDSWRQYANWYDEVNLQANDDLTDITATSLPGNSTLWWRVRYRDKSLEWSAWSPRTRFTTLPFDTLSTNILTNTGAESGIDSWIATIGVIESLGPGECAGINPYQGDKYFGVGALCVEHPFASAFQMQPISAFAGAIDSGLVLVNFGAYMADWQNTDEPAMALQFIDANNMVLASTDTLRHKQSAWTLKQNTIPVPVGTRRIKTILMGTRTSGGDNDSYVDNVFCRLLKGNITCSVYDSPGKTNGRVYVNPEAPANPDGESWATAFRTAGDAFLTSHQDTSIHEMWMAEGIYPVTTSSIRDTAFEITSSIAVYGGFAGNEITLAQRNLALHTTTLSGEIADTTNLGDNTYHVVKIANAPDTVILDGLHICCGYADGSGNTTGAGIYISADNDHPIILRHCTIEGNVAIEGASLHNQAVTLIDSSSISNTVIEGTSGGSILNTGIGAQLSLINTTITQECINCPEAITNRAGATLQIQEGVTIEKD
ncbi:MAG: fibronectin type III domain-containing protein [Saprospiraceae bacterium]|nr:fibronectin type III domain-containing protein [Candidatus Opimibacter skivensis]